MKLFFLFALLAFIAAPINAFTLSKNSFQSSCFVPVSTASLCCGIVSTSLNNLKGKNNSPTKTTFTCLHAENDSTGMTTLHFTGKQTFQSDPVPLRSYTTLKLFFEQDDLRTMLLAGAGDGDEPPRALPKHESISFKEQWTAQARSVGGEDPDPENGDVVCWVNTGSMDIAGLKVKSEAIIGTKLITGVDDLALPVYELVFIRDQRKAKGPKLLVWIFNRLTRKNSSGDDDDDNQNDKEEQSVSSFSRFYTKIINDDEDESSVVFAIDSSLDIAVKFPSLLLKILPVSKEKAEEQGSASVAKTLMNDTGAALQRISDSYRST
jgi:hypothetical protein